MNYAEIVVNTPLASSTPALESFTYSIPSHLANSIALGQLVWVPFGSRRLQGIVVGFRDTSPVELTKDLAEIVDPHPFLSPIQLNLARWIAQTYLCPLNDAIQLMLPAGIEQHQETLVELNPDVPGQDLSSREAALVQRLTKEPALRLTGLGRKERAVAETLVRRGILIRRTIIAPPRARAKHIQAVRLVSEEALVALLPKRIAHQVTALEFLARAQSPVPADQVTRTVPVPRATFKAMEAQGWIELTNEGRCLALTDKYSAEVPALPASQARVCVYLREHGGSVSADELASRAGATAQTLRALATKEYVSTASSPEMVVSKLTPAAALDRARELRNTHRYTEIIGLLREAPNPVWVSALYAATNCTRQDLRRLEQAGVISLEEKEVWRDSLSTRTFELIDPPTLTPEQYRAWNVIAPALKIPESDSPRPGNSSPPTFLLHGVTGSGKTEIYLRALAEVLAQGRQGLVLVPEISLTPQTIRRFGARFPHRIAVLHSRLSVGERYDTWRRCRDGKVDILIGSRSALFAPLPRLGLIVIDEEHEPAYMQESTPHYHARTVARELACLARVPLILGTATPDLESYYRAARGEYTLLELPQRIMGHREVIQSEARAFAIDDHRLAVHPLDPRLADARYINLPPVEIIDLRAELKAGNRSILSRSLQREMARVLAAREQVILFLNRRGTASFVLCRDCGNVFKCRRCDNPMTFHVSSGVNELVCHHCNRRDRVPSRCPQCASTRIRYFGAGTQKVEEEIRTLFPQARPLRWDLDTARGRDSHEIILEQFVQHRADVLIGTQMIAKGLDLPLVTLVGVISADTSLFLPDFRAGERTFQLLTQVAGRAGRSILGGKVILQTYNPDHYAVKAAARHDYAGFYAQELSFRREQGYPPFSRMIRLLFQDRSEKKCAEQSAQLHKVLAIEISRRGLAETSLIGPAPAFFHRLRGEYRYQILVRSLDPHALLDSIPLPLGWRVDVDPVSVL